MSIGTTVRIAGPYIGDGSSQVFPVSFKLFTKQDVYAVKTVIATGVNTVLVLDTDYTVTLNGDQNYTPGGTITLATPLLTTEKLTITTAVANLQPIDLNNQGGFYPDVINTGFDRATIQIQQLNDTITRTLRVPVSDGVTANQELPTKELRANKYFYFDSSGNPTVATGTSGAAVTAANNVNITANSAGANVGRDTIIIDNTTEFARFQGSTQRLGIRQASPAATLDVTKDTATTAFTGAVNGTGLFVLRDASTNGRYTNIDLATSAGVVLGRIGAVQNVGGSTLAFGTSNNYGTGITNTALQINESGIVTAATRFAVGTSNPLTVWRGNANVTSCLAIGQNSLSAALAATNTVVVGDGAGNNITNGASNVVVGNSAATTLTTGQFNTVVGAAANVGTAATSNAVAVGRGAIGQPSSVAIGWNAGSTGLASSGNNVLVGYQAGGGISNTDSLSNSVCIGMNAGSQANASGTIAIGSSALSSQVTGSNNVAVGVGAGNGLTSGTNNTFIGHGASSSSTGGQITTGSNNTCLGYQATPSTQVISNTITLGNSSIATLRCQVTTITALSDRRDKKDIEDLPSVMPLVDALRPRSFVWNMRDGGKVDLPEFGFIAQELLEAQQQSGIAVPGLVSQENPDRLEAAQGALLPVLLQAIKELKATVESQAARIAALEAAP